MKILGDLHCTKLLFEFGFPRLNEPLAQLHSYSRKLYLEIIHPQSTQNKLQRNDS